MNNKNLSICLIRYPYIVCQLFLTENQKIYDCIFDDGKHSKLFKRASLNVKDMSLSDFIINSDRSSELDDSF